MSSLNFVECANCPLGYCPCVVCLKNVFRHHQNVQEPNSKLLKLFVKLLERMSLASAILPKELGLCNDCAVIVESVTKLFHQIQCLQLQLDWNLNKVRKVMVSADSVPSRMKEFQELYKCEGMKTEDMKQLRSSITNTLNRHKASSFPKVVFNDCERTSSSRQRMNGNASKNLNKVPQTQPSITETEDNDRIFTHMSTCNLESAELNFGLGWMVSFITVALLGTIRSSEVSDTNTGAGANAKPFQSEIDNYETEAADDDHCSLIVYEALEETTEDVDADLAEPLTLPTLTPSSQSIPVVKLVKLNVTLPIPISPTETETNVGDSKINGIEKNSINTNASEPPKQDYNREIETGRRLLRRQYKCISCLMTFSTLLRLECHKKTCNTDIGKGTSTEHDDSNSSDEELTQLGKDKPWLKTEINTNDSESSSDNECSSPSSTSSDDESDANRGMAETKSLEVNKASESLSCEKCQSFQKNSVENNEIKQLHNDHMHSNGQTILDQRAIQLLQISGADVKLDTKKFSMHICSFPECKSVIFADSDSFEYHKSLHGAFYCDVCDFKCSFAVHLAIHETQHSPKTSEIVSCSRCSFETSADFKYYNHFLETHLKLITQRAKCGVCAKTFLDLTVPLQHYVNEHDVSRLENGSNVFRCCRGQDCSAYFLKRRQLYSHHWKAHLRNRRAKPKINPGTFAFACGKCSMRFHKRFQLSVHGAIVHSKVRDIGAKILTPNGVTINEVIYKTNATSCSVKKCQEKFMTQLELETHSKLHGTFPCQFCPKVFQYAPNLSLHERTHGSKLKKKKGLTQWKCPRCDYNTTIRHRYVHHHLETHLGLKPDQIRCPTCHYRFYGLAYDRMRTTLLYHFTKFHDPASLPSGQSFFNCDVCSANFITGLQLDNHKNQEHKLELTQRKTFKDSRMHSCPTCKRCFYTNERLKYHQRTVHLKKEDGRLLKYKCRTCLAVLKASSFNIYRQLTVFHKNYKHSNGIFNVPMTTVRHLSLTVEDIKLPNRFKKQICSEEGCEYKLFVSESSFQFHKSLHGNFSCNTCDYKCKYAIQLINHELDHSTSSAKGTSGMTCPRCQITPVDPVRHFLESHLNVDTTERSKCDICQAPFTEIEVPFHHFVNEHDLNRLDDMNIAFKCEEDKDICRAYFLTENQLQAHIQQIHRGVKRKPTVANSYSCDQCSKQFGDQLCFRIHVAKNHGGLESVGDKQITSDGMTIDELVNKKNAKYICSVIKCKSRFLTQEDLTSHSQLHGNFACVECQKVITFAPDLAIHEASHRIKPKCVGKHTEYTCCRCNDFTCFRKGKYVRHHLDTHLGLRADAIRCPICDQCFDEGKRKGVRKSLFNHYCVMHDVASLKPGEVVSKCDLCLAYFLTDTQLSNHIDNVHDRFNNKSRVCADCGKRLKTHLAVTLHRKRVHFVNESDFKFICEVDTCGQKFEYKIGLEGHVNGVHNQDYGTFKCHKCAQLFKQKWNFEQHVKNHGVTKTVASFVCEQCGKIFKTKAQWQQHQIYHIGPDGWQFVCEICSRKFGQKQHLKQHMKVHTKEKPYVCEVCGEKYANRRNWISHMNKKHNANIAVRQVDTTNMMSTMKGKKLVKHVPTVADSSESD